MKLDTEKLTARREKSPPGRVSCLRGGAGTYAPVTVAGGLFLHIGLQAKGGQPLHGWTGGRQMYKYFQIEFVVLRVQYDFVWNRIVFTSREGTGIVVIPMVPFKNVHCFVAACQRVKNVCLIPV